jgi:hypothetical protein
MFRWVSARGKVARTAAGGLSLQLRHTQCSADPVRAQEFTTNLVGAFRHLHLLVVPVVGP